MLLEETGAAHRRERLGELAVGGDREAILGRPEQQALVCGLPECSGGSLKAVFQVTPGLSLCPLRNRPPPMVITW